MYFKNPPSWLVNHPHYKSCFQRHNKEWYWLHQHVRFKNLGQAIMGAESFVKQCYDDRRKAA